MAGKYEKLQEVYGMSAMPTVDLRSEELGRRRRSLFNVMAGVCAFCVVAFFLSLCVVHLLYRQQWWEGTDGVIKLSHSMRGSDGVIQRVYSSRRDNIVEYYIEVSSNERNWILDDFNTELKIMKSESDGQSVCFVVKLNRTTAIPPNNVQSGYETYKSHLFGVYSPDEEPQTDKTFLGPFGQKLCDNADVYWMHPSDVTEVSDLGDISDVIEMVEPLTNTSVVGHHRGKRRVRQCRTSCCWRVCCCDITQFTWETIEHFTCAHVCNKKCTSQLYAIQKLC